MAMVFRSDLLCEVSGLSYDFKTLTGALRMSSWNCCDMSACIALFEGIDAGVKRIYTFAGDKPDTIYARSARGWRAFDPVENHSKVPAKGVRRRNAFAIFTPVDAKARRH